MHIYYRLLDLSFPNNDLQRAGLCLFLAMTYLLGNGRTGKPYCSCIVVQIHWILMNQRHCESQARWGCKVRIHKYYQKVVHIQIPGPLFGPRDVDLEDVNKP